MKFFCLSNHTNKPCNVLRFNQCTIMLDCSLDETSILNFLPVPLVPSERLQNLPRWQPKESIDLGDELKECSGRVFVDSELEFAVPQTSLLDLSDVDVILVSNYTAILALPFLVSVCGFSGTVYATAPTVTLGRLFMDELVSLMEPGRPGGRGSSAARWKQSVHLLPAPLCHVCRPRLWRRLYSRGEVATALSHVQTVGYGERASVFGLLTVTAFSSGYCLGAANWTIASAHEKVVYVSGSTTLTTHPKQLEQAALRDADLMVMTSLTQVPGHNPDAMIGEFCAKVAATVRNGGCVLVPCWSSGIVYDLIECLAPFLDQQQLSSVPLLFVSPGARRSLAYSNILAEWLSPSKQQRVYLPDDPFPHGHLLASGRLRAFDSLHAPGFSAEFRQPCVVFAGHPSLRVGAAVHLMHLWSSEPANAVIFTAPDFNHVDCLAPYQPLAIKCYFTPIDTALFFGQANKLLRDLKPSVLAVPHQYVPPSAGGDQLIEAPPGCQLLSFKRGDVLHVPIRRRAERVRLGPALAEALQVRQVRPGLSAASLTARLHVHDNAHWLHPIEPPSQHQLSDKQVVLRRLAEQRAPYVLFGSVVASDLLQRLAQHGFTDAKMEENSHGSFVHLQKEDVLIQLEKSSTHIIGEPDEKVRQTLRNILVNCLNKL